MTGWPGWKKILGKSAELSAFSAHHKNQISDGPRQLDSCGAMGNQLLGKLMRHPETATPREKALVARIADWVVNRQDRLAGWHALAA